MAELDDEDEMTPEQHFAMMQAQGMVRVYTPDEYKALMGEVMWVRPETAAELGYRLYQAN